MALISKPLAEKHGKNTSHSTVNRRRLLQSAGAGVVGLAGCTGGGGGDTPTPRVETVVKEQTVVKERTVVKEKTPEPKDLIPMKTLEL